MRLILVAAAFLLPASKTLQTSGSQYYWKDFNKHVPSDALVAGKDSKGNVYVGQGFLKDVGLLVGTLRDLDTHMEVEYGFKCFSPTNIKILCGATENFYWKKTSNSEFFQAILDSYPVVGGYQDAEGVKRVLHVGRLNNTKTTQVGKIDTSPPSFGNMYHCDGGINIISLSYEVLMYRVEERPDVDLRSGL